MSVTVIINRPSRKHSSSQEAIVNIGQVAAVRDDLRQVMDCATYRLWLVRVVSLMPLATAVYIAYVA